jgi:radical SAM protein with 4Fe4S-binding SPASM domain
MVVLGDGSVTNCMRTNKERVLLKPPAQYKTRNEILENIPQKQGGCQGCPYWKACYGGCPDSGLNGDWRNRTYMCPIWKALFGYFEKILNYCEQPVQNCLPPPVNKENNPIDPTGHGDRAHGDWGDFNRPNDQKREPNTEHGDNAHGDRAHGDWGDCHKPDNYKDDTKHLDGHGDRAHGDWADNNPPSRNNESKKDS